MRKARVPSTICIRLALAAPALAGPELAGPPVSGFLARVHDGAYPAANPAQGAAGPTGLLFLDIVRGDPGNRSAPVEARMAAQGQAPRDGVAGPLLRQVAACGDADRCFVDFDAGALPSVPRADGRTALVTAGYAPGAAEGGGGRGDHSALAGRPTSYRLSPPPLAECRAHWPVPTMPAPGCPAAD